MFQVKLIPSDPCNEEFQQSFQQTAALFFKYQRAIHKDPPEKCTEKRVIINVSVIFCWFKRQRTLLFPVKEMKCFDFQVLLFLALNHCTVCAELCLMVWTSKPNILKSDVIFYEFWLCLEILKTLNS